MSRKLIICNTYYQLILAIQLRYTLFKEDNIVVLLSDHSKNMETICERLNREHVFENTFFIKTKNINRKRNALDKIVDYFEISFAKTNKYSFYMDEVTDRFFDEIICYNYGINIIGLYSIVYESNPNVRISLFEEGILSYNILPLKNIRRSIISASRHAIGKKAVDDLRGCFYCFHPECYHGELSITKVPKIEIDGACAQILKRIFEINSQKLAYSQKYIFFTSVYDFEGAPIGEYEIVEKVAELVGKENLLIKTHPRDTRTIYTDNGYLVDNNSDIPWEPIQLSRDFSDKVFLTATSGSVLAGSFMSEKGVNTYFLYKLCNIQANCYAQNTVDTIEKLLNNDALQTSLEHVHIANKIEDILS